MKGQAGEQKIHSILFLSLIQSRGGMGDRNMGRRDRKVLVESTRRIEELKGDDEYDNNKKIQGG